MTEKTEKTETMDDIIKGLQDYKLDLNGIKFRIFKGDKNNKNIIHTTADGEIYCFETKINAEDWTLLATDADEQKREWAQILKDDVINE